ncbi:CoA-binding protein [Flexivirga caeni]|uniref:CoA-binding protein n=1 Tax=Flexivirga caeni TaxID=2294115 RepID=A0A3M9M920_9MICO|nr:CoA-binding protein [Flexivirga caeni]RNI21677.1 CoA-binding protein [Flexivirga caeni]
MTDTPGWTPPTTDELRDLLQTSRTIAVVGVSGNPARPSHGVAAYLVERTGYDVWLVNPGLTELFGGPVYPDLAALPGRPDIVDVFRRPAELASVTADAISGGAGALWFQLGLYDETAAATATSAGLTVVMDRCLKVDHHALIGPAR